MVNSMNKKNSAKSMILNYMMDYGKTSKVQLAKELNLSMPTVLTNVNELMELGVIEEVGEYESTGGRKARSIAVWKEYRNAVGVDITANHIGIVLVNLGGEVIKRAQYKTVFLPNMDYYSKLSEYIQMFLSEDINRDKILGMGVSLPGVIQTDERVLVKSHALKLENYSLKMIEQVSPFPVYFENDANASMMAENLSYLQNALYLSLNNTLGGAIYLNGSLFTGQNKKAGEFGHMILVPEGKKCYCGKNGCADAYCSARVLTENGQGNLGEFMLKLGKDESADLLWQDYLEKLAILISNLRMAYDTDIILGGEVGGYLSDYSIMLGEKLFQFNMFDGDLSYLKYCTYKKEASAVGGAKHFLKEFVNHI